MSDLNYQDIAALKRRCAKLEARCTALEATVAELKTTNKQLETVIRLSQPAGTKPAKKTAAVSKSWKTTVIQKLNWNYRKGNAKEAAREDTIARLNKVFGSAKVQAEMLEYVTSEADRIYAEGEPTPAEEQAQTAGEA